VDENGASATDEDVMQKSMRRKADRNLDAFGTSPSYKSFTSFSPSRMVSNFSSVGVSLGKNSNDIKVSTSVLKHMEYDCLTVVRNVSNVLNTTLLEDG
jgi:hypothetical protein